MSHPSVVERRLARLGRDFEFSRLEGQLVAAAYELLAPPLHRSVPTADLPSGSARTRPGGVPRLRRAQGGSGP